MKLHAYVAIPSGIKYAPDGTLIDFKAIYENLLKPAIEDAGLAVFETGIEQTADGIPTDRFQTLLIADVVVADLTLDLPDIWYELGIRHALRSGGTVLVRGLRSIPLFDKHAGHKLDYSLNNGIPDPAALDKDKIALTAMIKTALQSRHDRQLSPVYRLLPELQEPVWQVLRINAVKQFWATHDAWEEQIESACKRGDIGGLLVLAEEVPVSIFRAQAYLKAGIALRKARSFDFALEQLEKVLAMTPENLTALQETGICLQHLALSGRSGHSLARARNHYRQMLQKHPNDTGTWTLLGHIDRDAWIESWKNLATTVERRKVAASRNDLLARAIASYSQAFQRNPRHYHSGINALTLMHLRRDLNPDTHQDAGSTTIAGAVGFSAESETRPHRLFQAKVTLGDLQTLTGTPETVISAYQEAIAHAEQDWSILNAALNQLRLLASLEFNPETVNAGIYTLQRALAGRQKPEDTWQPRQVLLFSGHMVDASDRAIPRFPADKEAIAAQKIGAILDELAAGPEDLALTQGANGGDILFAEACLQRCVKLTLLQPFDESAFIQKSVLPAGKSWRERYYAIKPEARIKAAPVELGAAPKDTDPYERCNLWLLYTALAYGTDKARFICLWNGAGGDAPGGTAHMYQEVKEKTGQVDWLDTRTLW